MHLLKRRGFLRGLGLGVGGTLLTPLCGRLIRRAMGEGADDRRVIFITTNQGWSTEADDRMVSGPGYKPGANSAMFKAAWRSETDWDLPAFLEPLSAWKSKLAILYGFRNFFNAGGAPHGSGHSTLTAVASLNPDDDSSAAGGISIDRFLGKELKAKHGDLIDSTNMATLMYGQYQTSTSSDGSGKPADAYASPLKAYATYFGNGVGMTPQQAQATLALDKSLLDGVASDIDRARMKLAGFEQQKLDQVLESMRELEKKLTARAMTAGSAKPMAPTIDNGSLTTPTVRAFLDVTWQAHAFGLTHASHVAIHGYNTESDSRRAVVPDIREDDTHNAVYHTNAGNYSSIEDREADVTKINKWQGAQIAYLLDKLAAQPGGGGGTLADDTLIVWINAGGYMHHRGHFNHPVLLLGNLHGKVRTPLWMDMTEYVSGELYRLQGKRHMADAFLTIANAVGSSITTFGDPKECKGVVPGVLT